MSIIYTTLETANEVIKKKIRRLCRLWFLLIYRRKSKIYPKVVSEVETIKKIINERSSVSRFGDGEMNWILKIEHSSFEKVSDKLSEKLIEVIQSDLNGHINCIPSVSQTMDSRTKESQLFWKKYIGEHATHWRTLCTNQKYYDANFTRPYIAFFDKRKSIMTDKFELLKGIWDKREILIVEGKLSRLGVGNNLFSNAKKIYRIVCPAKNAFEKYELIKEKTLFYCSKLSRNILVIIALGPTATILAYDLAIEGFQGVDIGHVDIEYEWFLRGVEKKINVPGKYTNESGHFVKKTVDIPKELLEENEYHKSILCDINELN